MGGGGWQLLAFMKGPFQPLSPPAPPHPSLTFWVSGFEEMLELRNPTMSEEQFHLGSSHGTGLGSSLAVGPLSSSLLHDTKLARTHSPQTGEAGARAEPSTGPSWAFSSSDRSRHILLENLEPGTFHLPCECSPNALGPSVSIKLPSLNYSSPFRSVLSAQTGSGLPWSLAKVLPIAFQLRTFNGRC